MGAVLNDLFVCYINNDCKKYKQDLERRLSESIQTKLGKELSQKITVSLNQHLTKQEIISSLDPKQLNLTFKNGNDLKKQANTLLVPAHAQKFQSLTAREVAVITAWYSLRNYLTHKSKRAHREMRNSFSVRELDVALR